MLSPAIGAVQAIVYTRQVKEIEEHIIFLSKSHEKVVALLKNYELLKRDSRNEEFALQKKLKKLDSQLKTILFLEKEIAVLEEIKIEKLLEHPTENNQSKKDDINQLQRSISILKTSIKIKPLLLKARLSLEIFLELSQVKSKDVNQDHIALLLMNLKIEREIKIEKILLKEYS